MTATATRSAEDIVPITFATDARDVAAATYDGLLALLEGLDPQDWKVQTECPGWTVADMVGHMIGAARAAASMREAVRQQVWAVRHKKEFDGNDLDAMNAFQVRAYASLSPAAKMAALREAVPGALKGRERLPGLLRRVRVPVAQSGSSAGMPPSLSLGHLMDVIYTRDVWMHRVDIARATGRALDLDAAVDGRIVEDVVAEWAARHAQPFSLRLTGPAGGAFRSRDGGQNLELDAVEFCRAVSGRSSGGGLLDVLVLF